MEGPTGPFFWGKVNARLIHAGLAHGIAGNTPIYTRDRSSQRVKRAWML